MTGHPAFDRSSGKQKPILSAKFEADALIEVGILEISKG